MVDDQNELHIYVMYPPYYYALVLTCDWLNECFKKKVLPHFPKITMWKLGMLQNFSMKLFFEKILRIFVTDLPHFPYITCEEVLEQNCSLEKIPF